MMIKYNKNLKFSFGAPNYLVMCIIQKKSLRDADNISILHLLISEKEELCFDDEKYNV